MCFRFFLGCFITMLLVACGSRSEPNFAPVIAPGQAQGQYGRDYHIVERGETLYAVAFRYSLDYRELARINDIEPPFAIKIGDKLLLRANGNHARVVEATPLSAKSRQVKQVKETPRIVAKKSIEALPKPSVRQVIPKTLPKRIAPKRANFANVDRQISRGRWVWPIKGPVATTYAPKLGRKGISITSHEGMGVRAAHAGRVAYAGDGIRGYGNLVIIKHNNEYLSAYANNRKLFVKEGQAVLAGQVIAEVGRNNSAHYSLHFEIRRKGKPVNPLKYLAKS